MVSLDLSTEQVITLIRQLSLNDKYTVLSALNTELGLMQGHEEAPQPDPAQALAEIAALPQISTQSQFSGRNHDQLLYPMEELA